MIFLENLKYFKSIWRWSKARSLMSKGDFAGAKAILSDIDLPLGYKQIALVQLGNCSFRERKFQEAIKNYRNAIDVELSWTERANPNVRNYIVNYANFFLDVANRSLSGGDKIDNIDLYDELISSNVSKKLKLVLLPLPLRSSLRQKNSEPKGE